MKQEDKELLLKDLCARLLYGVICLLYANGTSITEELKIGGLEQFMLGGLEVKPYLRPMSSMTEEEEKEYKTISIWGEVRESKDHYTDICPTIEGYDWLNAHHFDYRGLIPMGLAIEVTESNNPYKE